MRFRNKRRGTIDEIKIKVFGKMNGGRGRRIA